MKHLVCALLLLSFIACDEANREQALQNRIDSLEQKLNETYKPGFGEFMSNIQVHHEKLWFAGENENWKLADFEIHEIMEALDDIKQFEKNRPESKEIDMLKPAIDSMNNAITKKDAALFKSSFIFLTNTCNNCHRTVNFEFNVVKMPETPPFSNQSFKVEK